MLRAVALLRHDGRDVGRAVEGDELVLLVHVHVVGGLHRHTLEGEAEAAGLLGLLVGGEDARGLVGCAMWDAWTHRYATRHAAAPLWDFCVPCGHISPRRPFPRL